MARANVTELRCAGPAENIVFRRNGCKGVSSSPAASCFSSRHGPTKQKCGADRHDAQRAASSQLVPAALQWKRWPGPRFYPHGATCIAPCALARRPPRRQGLVYTLCRQDESPKECRGASKQHVSNEASVPPLAVGGSIKAVLQRQRCSVCGYDVGRLARAMPLEPARCAHTASKSPQNRPVF